MSPLLLHQRGTDVNIFLLALLSSSVTVLFSFTSFYSPLPLLLLPSFSSLTSFCFSLICCLRSGLISRPLTFLSSLDDDLCVNTHSHDPFHLLSPPIAHSFPLTPPFIILLLLLSPFSSYDSLSGRSDSHEQRRRKQPQLLLRPRPL